MRSRRTRGRRARHAEACSHPGVTSASARVGFRHRLNPHGNRQLNHAIHMIAVTQVRHDTPGRAYYRHKQAAGHSRKEAMRALKRRISDAEPVKAGETTSHAD